MPVHLPWLIPLLGLLVVVAGLWMRGRGPAGQSSRGGSQQTLLPSAAESAGEDRTTESDASDDADAAEPRVWRVVDVPTVDDDCVTVGEAVRQASDGDVIEVACAEPRDDGPFSIDGKHLTLRAAPGIEPILRFG